MCSAAFSPDGVYVVTASSDLTARVWRADGTGEPVVTLRGHEGPGVLRGVLARRGVRGHHVVRRRRACGGGRYGRAVVPAGARRRCVRRGILAGRSVMVTASETRRRACGEQTDRRARMVAGHGDRVNSATFSPDGAHVFTCAPGQHGARVAATGSGETVSLRGRDHPVTSAAFSPDGAYVVAAYYDNAARAPNGTAQASLWSCRGAKARCSAQRSRDGVYVVTASDDHTARVCGGRTAGEPWSCGARRQLVRRGILADGVCMVTASADKTQRAWRADGTGRKRGPAGARRQSVQRGIPLTGWGVRGHRIIRRPRTRVWRADGTGEPVVLQAHEDRLHSARSHRTGCTWPPRLATPARVWRATARREPVLLRARRQRCTAWHSHRTGCTWSPASQPRHDGARVAADGTGEPWSLRAHEDSLYSVAFCRTGVRVTASNDNTARAMGGGWHGEQVLPAHEGSVGLRGILAGRGVRGHLVRQQHGARAAALLGVTLRDALERHLVFVPVKKRMTLLGESGEKPGGSIRQGARGVARRAAAGAYRRDSAPTPTPSQRPLSPAPLRTPRLEGRDPPTMPPPTPRKPIRTLRSPRPPLEDRHAEVAPPAPPTFGSRRESGFFDQPLSARTLVWMFVAASYHHRAALQGAPPASLNTNVRDLYPRLPRADARLRGPAADAGARCAFTSSVRAEAVARPRRHRQS